MKIFLTGTVLTFIVLTLMPAILPATDYVYLFGYPQHFYKYEGAIPSQFEYQSHVFKPLNFLTDLGFSALAGAAIFVALRGKKVSFTIKH